MRELPLLALLSVLGLSLAVGCGDDDGDACGNLTPCDDNPTSCPNETAEYFCWALDGIGNRDSYCCATLEQACQAVCGDDECPVVLTEPPQPGCEQ